MDLESSPIKTLDELLKWSPERAVGRPAEVKLKEKNAWTVSVNQPRTLLCHDMRGGYLSDRFTNGCQVACDEPYLFYHWSHIHGFIYFSHNFVTIPPTGWINAAHRNGVPVFGTLITEWDDGKAIWERLLSDPELIKRSALLLVEIAEHYGFEGWLINIENSIKPEDIDLVLMFLHHLRQAATLKVGKRGPIIIWYDSVTIKGALEWQNSLNGHNMKFFQFVDGIFLNYNWKLRDLATAKETATRYRQYDVFVGVDVFGRGCYGGGGWNTDLALEVIRQHDMSLAMFAPGWVLECNESCDFLTNQDKFWSSLSPYLPIHKSLSLPIETSFCVGYGRIMFNQGEECALDAMLTPKVTDSGPSSSDDYWLNLTRHGLQPTFKRDDCHENGTIKLCHDDGWSGGGCLELVAWAGGSTWNLLQTDIPVSRGLRVELTFKFMTSNPKFASNCDVMLSVRRNLSKRAISLVCLEGMAVTGEISPYRVFPRDSAESSPGWDGLCWRTVCFDVSDVLVGGYVLECVALRVVGRPTVRVQLGSLRVAEASVECVS